MLTLIQPALTPALVRPPESDPTLKILEKRVQARHAAIEPGGFAASSTSNSEVSLSTMVESALATNGTYGLLSSLSLSEAANEYESTSKLLGLFYDNRMLIGSQVDLDA